MWELIVLLAVGIGFNLVMWFEPWWLRTRLLVVWAMTLLFALEMQRWFRRNGSP